MSDASVIEPWPTLTNPFSLAMSRGEPLFEPRVATVREIVNRGAPGGTSISGGPNLGKSLVLKSLRRHAASQNDFPANRMLFEYIDCHSIETPEGLFRRIDRSTEGATEGLDLEPDLELRSVSRSDDQDLAEAIDRRLRRLSRAGYRLVLALDHFDRVFMRLRRLDDTAIRSFLQHASLVFASRKSLADLSRETEFQSLLASAVDLRNLGLLTREQVARGLSQTLQAALGERGVDGFNDVAEIAADQSGGNPGLALAIAGWLWDRQAEGRVTANGNAIYEQMRGSPEIERILDSLWAAANQREQQAIMALVEGGGQPREQIESASTLLGLSLVTNESGQYVPFSRLFGDYVRELVPPDIGLSPQDRALVSLLISKRGEACSIDEIGPRIWGRQVEPNALHVALARIRKALRDHPGSGAVVKVAGRGPHAKALYRFVANAVQEPVDSESSSAD
jgi:hypothetical protein